MVLLGVPKADLPPVKPPPPKRRPMGGSMAQPAKSLAPRISDLSATLASKSSEEGKVKGACAELALLASRSVSACMAVADAEIEKPLSQVLIKQSDPATQCWVMSILSNCARVHAEFAFTRAVSERRVLMYRSRLGDRRIDRTHITRRSSSFGTDPYPYFFSPAAASSTNVL